MKSSILSTLAAKTVVITMLCLVGQSASAAEKALLDILLGNGVITQAQYDSLMKKESLTSTDILGTPEAAAQVEQAVDEKVEKAVAEAVDKRLDASIGEKIAKKSTKISRLKRAMARRVSASNPRTATGKPTFSGARSYVTPTHLVAIPVRSPRLIQKTRVRLRHAACV